MPRCLSAARMASVTVVLPAPECGAAMISPRAVIIVLLRRRPNLAVPSRCASAKPAAIVGVIKRAVAKVFRGQSPADHDQRRALDFCRRDLGGDIGKRAAQYQFRRR